MRAVDGSDPSSIGLKTRSRSRHIEGDANIAETATTSPLFVQHGHSATLQVTP